MTSDSGIMLSILIPTLEDRHALFSRLVAEIDHQVAADGVSGLVETLSVCDDGTASIGAKRNQLLEQANGRFVVFIDDDDSIAGDYIHSILTAIRSNDTMDCISFNGKITFRGSHARLMRHSIRYADWQYEGGDYVRPPCHIMPIRRDIATQYRFAEKDHAEDMDWTLKMSADGALKHEVQLDRILYHYHCRRPYAVQWVLDRTQAVRHALGLRFAGKTHEK